MPRRSKPASHQPFRFGSSCQTKRRFGTERQAKEAADYQMLVKSDLELSVYKCELCGGWHLTRTKPLV
ncbi:MAG: iviTM7 [Candidatus Saccharibacteria bacterium]|nr:iviTM7 [Candidatus Saccharibacteria bacterium]